MTTLERAVETLDAIDEKQAFDSLSSSLFIEENPVIESARTILSVSSASQKTIHPTQLTSSQNTNIVTIDQTGVENAAKYVRTLFPLPFFIFIQLLFRSPKSLRKRRTHPRHGALTLCIFYHPNGSVARTLAHANVSIGSSSSPL